MLKDNADWFKTLFKNLVNSMRKLVTRRDHDDGEDLDAEHYFMDAIGALEEGKFLDAAQRFEMLAKLVPDHPLARLMLGRSYVELLEFEKAVTTLHEHLNIDPNSVEARIYLGLAYAECGQPDLAEEMFKEALAIKSNSMLAMEDLIIVKISSGRLDEALEELVRLNKEHPKDRNIIELIVLVLGQQGAWQAASQYVHG
jgi:tetratricopeptide (TPR) repeat protein